MYIYIYVQMNKYIFIYRYINICGGPLFRTCFKFRGSEKRADVLFRVVHLRAVHLSRHK